MRARHHVGDDLGVGGIRHRRLHHAHDGERPSRRVIGSNRQQTDRTADRLLMCEMDRGEPFVLRADASGPSRRLLPRSEGEFITEHYWGYTRQRNGDTLEYQVEHPAWNVWEATTASFVGWLRGAKW